MAQQPCQLQLHFTSAWYLSRIVTEAEENCNHMTAMSSYCIYNILCSLSIS